MYMLERKEPKPIRGYRKHLHLWLYQFYLEAGGNEREPDTLKAIIWQKSKE